MISLALKLQTEEWRLYLKAAKGLLSSYIVNERIVMAKKLTGITPPQYRSCN